MHFADKRKKLLRNIFTPPAFPYLTSQEVKKELEEMMNFNSNKKRVEFFNTLTLKRKVQVFEHLPHHIQIGLLARCNYDEILVLCNSLSPAIRFILEKALERKGIL